MPQRGGGGHAHAKRDREFSAAMLAVEAASTAAEARETQEAYKELNRAKRFWRSLRIRILLVVVSIVLYIFVKWKSFQNRLPSAYKWYNDVAQRKDLSGDPSLWLSLDEIVVSKYSPPVAKLLNKMLIIVLIEPPACSFALDVISSMRYDPTLLTHECWGGVAALTDESLVDTWLPPGKKDQAAYATWQGSASQNPWVAVYQAATYEEFFALPSVAQFMDASSSTRLRTTPFGIMLKSGISGLMRKSWGDVTGMSAGDMYYQLFSVAKNRKTEGCKNTAGTSFMMGSMAGLGMMQSLPAPYGILFGAGATVAVTAINESGEKERCANEEAAEEDETMS